MTYTLEIQYLTPRERVVGGQASRSGITDNGLINMVRIRVIGVQTIPAIAARITVVEKNDFFGVATVEVKANSDALGPMFDEWFARQKKPPIIGDLLMYSKKTF